MISKKAKNSFELFRSSLTQILSHDHPLYKLADKIDWSAFEAAFGPTYCPENGRPAKPIRLLVGLHFLKYAFCESDESVVERWVENPYWQYFCGMTHFTHELPCDSTLLVKWRHRVGAQKLEQLLASTIDCARRKGLLTKTDFAFVNVDTTVQEKNIAFPTDSRLLDKSRRRLVNLAKKKNIRLRQSFNRVAKTALINQHHFARTRKFKKAARATSQLRTYLGRVVRDIDRKAEPLDIQVKNELDLARRLLAQKRNDKNKLYSLHEPDVHCIAKGKAHKKYEFGCKVGLLSTPETCWIVGAIAFEGNPYDGHTLADSLATMERVTGERAVAAFCDRGYRVREQIGVTQVRIPGTGPRKKCKLFKYLSRRRSSIEPIFGHLKSDNRMGRNFLKGVEGDKINAILAAAGFNFRKLLRAFFCAFWNWLRIEFPTLCAPVEFVFFQFPVMHDVA